MFSIFSYFSTFFYCYFLFLFYLISFLTLFMLFVAFKGFYYLFFSFLLFTNFCFSNYLHWSFVILVYFYSYHPLLLSRNSVSYFCLLKCFDGFLIRYFCLGDYCVFVMDVVFLELFILAYRFSIQLYVVQAILLIKWELFKLFIFMIVKFIKICLCAIY